MANGLSCGFSAGRFSEKDEKKPSRQAGTAGEEVKTRVRIRYISWFYRPFHWADRLPRAEVFRPSHRGVHPKGSFIARPMGGARSFRGQVLSYLPLDGSLYPGPKFIVRFIWLARSFRNEVLLSFPLGPVHPGAEAADSGEAAGAKGSH